MRTVLAIVTAVLSVAGMTNLANATTISNNFISSDEGWTVGDADSPTGSKSAPTYSPTGGSPGGTISTGDIASTVAFFAPSAYLGDMSSFYGGAFSYNIADLAGNDGTNYAALILYGAGQAISIAHTPPSNTADLSSFSFALTEAGFDVYNPGGYQGSTPVSQATFKAVLADLTGVAIDADWRSGGDNTFLANVSLVSDVSPVPLPASAPMFGAALLVLAGLGFTARRKRVSAAA